MAAQWCSGRLRLSSLPITLSLCYESRYRRNLHDSLHIFWVIPIGRILISALRQPLLTWAYCAAFHASFQQPDDSWKRNTMHFWLLLISVKDFLQYTKSFHTTSKPSVDLDPCISFGISEMDCSYLICGLIPLLFVLHSGRYQSLRGTSLLSDWRIFKWWNSPDIWLCYFIFFSHSFFFSLFHFTWLMLVNLW